LGQTFTNTATFDPNNPGGGLKISGAPPPVAAINYLSSGAGYNVQEQFSAIDIKRQKGRLIAAIKEVYPIVDDLSLQTLPGPIRINELYCTIEELPEQMPLGLLSAGIYRFISILIGIATAEDGVLLVDEIENGIFYENFENAWQAIVKFSKQYNVQVFASTHSKECLDALKPLLKKNSSDFRLLRAETLKSGGHTVRIFKGSQFEAALETGTDVR
jgi:predicted ATPase